VHGICAGSFVAMILERYLHDGLTSASMGRSAYIVCRHAALKSPIAEVPRGTRIILGVGATVLVRYLTMPVHSWYT
jgi:hypothetical protein